MNIQEIRTVMFDKVNALLVDDSIKAKMHLTVTGVCEKMAGLDFEATSVSYNGKSAIKITFSTSFVKVIQVLAKKIKLISALEGNNLYIF